MATEIRFRQQFLGERHGEGATASLIGWWRWWWVSWSGRWRSHVVVMPRVLSASGGDLPSLGRRGRRLTLQSCSSVHEWPVEHWRGYGVTGRVRAGRGSRQGGAVVAQASVLWGRWRGIFIHMAWKDNSVIWEPMAHWISLRHWQPFHHISLSKASSCSHLWEHDLIALKMIEFSTYCHHQRDFRHAAFS